MPTTRSPRHGSMQYWPRKRAKKQTARVRSMKPSKKPGLQGFAGYKIGMTTVLNTQKNYLSKKGDTIDTAVPVTVIECPPLKVASIRFYKKNYYGLKCVNEILGKTDKELDRKLKTPKKIDDSKLNSINPSDYYDIRLNVYTIPKLTAVGKKKPDIFEITLGGKIEDKWAYAKENFGKEILISDVFDEGAQVDIHSVTTGRGFQGPVKRFGIGLTSHKAEKARRNPGSLGGWKAQGHFMYRIAHAGQTGYHLRTEHNKVIMKISDKPEEVNPNGGFVRYGLVKGTYILLKGSVGGPAKRLIRFNMAQRPNSKFTKEKPALTYVSLESKQRK
jgi:large subunit ribosomal protein L3